MNLSKDIDLGDKRSNENIYNSSKILKIKDKMMLALSNKESNKKKEYKSTADLRREKLASYTAWSFVIIGLGGACYMGRKWTDDEIKQSLDVKDKFSSTFFGRLKQRTSSLFNYYNEPAFDKLLPDPLPELYQRRFTLVLDLDDLLIHSEWSREHGWRIAKRPGLDYFLSYLSQYYEIVIFTTQYAATAIPIIQKLDPYRSSLSASLFREATRYVNGKLIKDLSYMNRPLDKIIMLDVNPDSYSFHPDNAIPMEPWKGDPDDKELISLIPFLEYIASMEVSDVRPVIASYKGKHIPTEWALREKMLKENMKKEWEEQNKNTNSWVSFFLNGTTKRPYQVPQLITDQQRERAQHVYAEYQQYLKDHGEEILNQEKQREREQMSAMKTSINSLIFEGIPKPSQHT
ncbi:hypothetical protein MERGE_001508 [Pneumocystis wakefieldiae]|uniref:Mitochondrial import inner membrane translocase subunit TIM50 n=1 Tax=Pneumocystis wakefieldiae TaxID=38082 RepID=A0A899G6T5_9ASCO|nr:hypothetical protein MERGE_001508 [Pneumocystis wakefieldiae]